jgi:hypothetical protein
LNIPSTATSLKSSADFSPAKFRKTQKKQKTTTTFLSILRAFLFEAYSCCLSNKIYNVYKGFNARLQIEQVQKIIFKNFIEDVNKQKVNKSASCVQFWESFTT